MNAKQFGMAMALAAGLGMSGVAEANYSSVTQDGTKYTVTYTANIPWTINGSDVTNVILFEADSDGAVYVDYPHTLAVGGVVALRHTVAYLPTKALVIGTDLAIPGDTTSKNHVVMFLDDAFAQANAGKLFRDNFPRAGLGDKGESAFIAHLLLAAAGDVSAMNDLKSYFATGSLAPAAFTPGESFAVAESSPLALIPEPATLALLGLGLAGLGFSRRRAH